MNMLSLHSLRMILVFAVTAMYSIGILVQSYQITPTRITLIAKNSMCDDLVTKSDDITTLPPKQHQNIPTHTPSSNDKYCTHYSGNEMSRRRLLKTTCHTFTVTVSLSTSTTIIPTTTANALQPRNEALCSTGLFEHFLEYKCTPIGDIQDEGIGKELSSVEEQTTNSLLSKLGIDNDTSSNWNVKEDGPTTTNNTNRPKQQD
jgi:hypothetical protein